MSCLSLHTCVGDDQQARAKVAQVAATGPHNGYLKYRLAHVFSELGDAEAAVRTLSEAIHDGFRSVQLLSREELLGMGKLVPLTEYHLVKETIQQKVQRLKARYAPQLMSTTNG